MNADRLILAQVQSIVEQVLGCEPEEATPEARFFADLGGESIDFLDLSFRCDKQFGVKLGFEKLLDAETAAGKGTGTLTADSLRNLKERFPFLDYGLLPEQPTKAHLADLLTVDAIACFVGQALAERDQQPASGQS